MRRVQRIQPRGVWDSSRYRFSQATIVECNKLLYISGQVGMDKNGGIVGTDFEAQAEQAFKNIEAILREVGADWEDISKLNIYLLDMNNLPKLSEIAEKYFKGTYPAQTVVEVKKLALPELQLEIEAIAVIS